MNYERLVVLAANVRKGDQFFNLESCDYNEVLTDAHDGDGSVEFVTWRDAASEFMAMPYSAYCMVLRPLPGS